MREHPGVMSLAAAAVIAGMAIGGCGDDGERAEVPLPVDVTEVEPAPAVVETSTTTELAQGVDGFAHRVVVDHPQRPFVVELRVEVGGVALRRGPHEPT